MDPLITRDIIESISIIVLRIISLAVGTLITYFGYRLFEKGIVDKAGDLDGEFRSAKLSLKSAAPGTFFALFGALIISLAIFKKIRFESSDEKEYPVNSQSSVPSQKINLPENPPK